MRKAIATILLLIALSATTKAQVNLQEMYDFGRHHLTTTLEMFQADKWGSSFYFVDLYHPFDMAGVMSGYAEISRSLNFWQQSSLAPLSLHVEWNGGNGLFSTPTGTAGYTIANAWLFGAEWFFHSTDYSRQLTLQVMYKHIVGTESALPMQITLVWGMKDVLLKGLNFSGFADLWWQDNTWQSANPTTTRTVFLAEPQLWYSLTPHLNLGGEVELSYNFAGNSSGKAGWDVSPCLGAKWVF